MTTLYVWHISDTRTGPDRRGAEIVAVTINEDPCSVAGIPLAYAERTYLGEYYGGGIWPKTSADAALWNELEDRQIQKRRRV